MTQPRIRRFLKHGTLPQLKAFETVARLGSVTRAAAELNLAQATVSGHLRKLSQTAEATLFRPEGRRLSLTPAGDALASVAAELFATLERAERELGSLRDAGAGGRLAVAAEDDALFAARLLARFAAGHPRLEVAMRFGTRLELNRRLAKRADDVYLVVEPPARGSDHEPLRPNPLLLCACRGHELAGCRNLAFAQIARQTLLVREPGSRSRSALERLLRRHGTRPRRMIEFSSDEAIRQATSTGTGIALLSRDALDAAACDADLAPLDVEGWPLPQRWFGFVPAGTVERVAARAFLGFLRAEARAPLLQPDAASALARVPPSLLAA